jgi:hypothetical protein
MKGEGIEVDLDVKLTDQGQWPGLRKEKGVKVLEGAKLAAIWTAEVWATEDTTRTVVAMRIDLGGGRVALAEETLSSFLNCAAKVRAYYETQNKIGMTTEELANYKALGAMLQTPELKEAFEAGMAEIERLRSAATGVPVLAPVPMLLWCPQCSERHIDFGEFATRPHHTHACQNCGMVWRPALVPTVGVDYLPGFKNEAPRDESETVVSEEQLEKLGKLVDRIDNLVHARKLQVSDGIHLRALGEALPDLHSELKTLYVEIAGDDPWAEIAP